MHTIKTLSVINAAPFEHAAREIEAYSNTVLVGLHAFRCQTGPVEHTGSTTKTNIVIMFGSDHGLCGSCNESLASHVALQLGKAARETIVLCVGAQMAYALRDSDLTPDKRFFRACSSTGLAGWPTS